MHRNKYERPLDAAVVKLQHDGNGQFKITLPKSIILAKGWKKGDLVRILLDEKGNLILRREQ